MATACDQEKKREVVELLQRTTTGDITFFQEFEAKTKGYIEKRLRFYGSDIPKDDLPDLTNKVYARFFLYYLSGAFAPICDGQIFACLDTMAQRVVYDHIRKRNRQNEAEAGFLAAQQPNDPYLAVENAIDREKIARNKLQYQMIELRANGKTYQEIADALELKLYQVTSYFYKLRKKAKKS